MKKGLILAILLILVFSLASCGNKKNGDETSRRDSDTLSTSVGDISIEQGDIAYVSELVSGKFSKFELTVDCEETSTEILFAEDQVRVTGIGATAQGTTVTISAGGCYRVSGQCTDGGLIVNVPKTEKVHLIFEGLSLSSATTAPLIVSSADKILVTLANGTQNVLTDAESRAADDLCNACVYAKDSISFNGTGALSVNGRYNNGIDSSNNVKFISGTYTVNAVKNGIKGNDSIAVLDADIRVTAGKDAFKTETPTVAGEGFIYIAGGNFTITAGDDGLQSATDIELQGGRFTFNVTGKRTNNKGNIHKSLNVVYTV